MDEREFRSKVYWLTFIFSILVIWVHSGNAELFLGPGQQMDGPGAWNAFLAPAWASFPSLVF